MFSMFKKTPSCQDWTQCIHFANGCQTGQRSEMFTKNTPGSWGEEPQKGPAAHTVKQSALRRVVSLVCLYRCAQVTQSLTEGRVGRAYTWAWLALTAELCRTRAGGQAACTNRTPLPGTHILGISSPMMLMVALHCGYHKITLIGIQAL